MKLKCRIKNKIYDFVQGNDFADEFNETLDSGSIIISNVNKIKDLDIYDDVYIYNADEDFNGYKNFTEKEYINFKLNTQIEIKNNSDYEENTSNWKRWIEINFIDLVDKLKNNTIKKQNIIMAMTNIYPFENNPVAYVSYNFVYENGKYSLVPKNKNFPIYSDFVEEENNLIGKFPMGAFPEYPDGSIYFPYTPNLFYDTAEIHYVPFSNNSLPKFFKHLLVGTFTENTINLIENKYKYKIELISETKGLEVVQLPNISITQSLNIDKKLSIYDIAKNMVDLYSPKIKMVIDKENKIWEYKQKYVLDSSIKDMFSDAYSPDFSLNNPNLRDILSQLFITKDMIPYVNNNVIYAMDISLRGKEFNFDIGKIFYNIEGAKTNENYADNLKRTYSNALSQDYSCRMVEKIGFRNSSTALMTIGNMRLETRYPIYKINKVYMCYYKKGDLYYGGSYRNTQKMFLCKQDITPLVKLNSERNLLNKNWNDFENLKESIDTIEELAEYQISTVGYDIGTNIISGWGQKYSYLKDYKLGHWSYTKTYLENILQFMDEIYPYGIYSNQNAFKENLAIGESIVFGDDFFKNYINPFSNDSLGLKGIFFEIDYNAFYNGTIIHSKSYGKDKATINDNSSSSLTLLEKDGLLQQEKINRFGNKGIMINATYKNIDELQDVGTVINREDIGKDYIIYRREYSIFDNEIKCVYYATKNYVLKNYFTTVYAKHRPYNLMSYNESVRRSENKKLMFLFSKDKLYYEDVDNVLKFTHFESEPLTDLFSFLRSSPKIKNVYDTIEEKKINNGYIKFDNKRYLSDINSFVSGNSLCFNLSMFDNVSGGVYVKVLEPDFNATIPEDASEVVKDDWTGSLQEWYMMIDDIETGYAEQMGFYICHIEDKKKYNNELLDCDEDKIKNNVYNKLFALPLIKYDLFDEDKEEYVEPTNDEIQYVTLNGKSVTWKENDNVIPTYIISFNNEDLNKLREDMIIDMTFDTVGKLNKTKSYPKEIIYFEPTITHIDSIEKDDNGDIIKIIVNANYQIKFTNAISSIPSKKTLKNVKMSFEYTGDTIDFSGTKISYGNTDTNKYFSCKINEIIYDNEIYNFNNWCAHSLDKQFINSTNDNIVDNENNFYSYSKTLEIDNALYNSNIIGNNIVLRKDNKEVIDMTFQFEPYTNNTNDVLFSNWIMKLSDLLSFYNKIEEDYGSNNTEEYKYYFDIKYTSYLTSFGTYTPYILLSIEKELFDIVNIGDNIKGVIEYPMTIGGGTEAGKIHYYKFEFKKIEDILENKIAIKGIQTISYNNKIYQDETIMNFKVKNNSSDIDNVYFEACNPESSSLIENITFYDNTLEIPSNVTISFVNFNFWTPNNEINDLSIELTKKNSIWDKLYYIDENGYVFYYRKNMFIKLSEDSLKNHLIYDEYLSSEISLSDLKVSDIFKLEGNLIKVDLSKIENKNTKSIQYWYFDTNSNSMKFVFGVNIREEDWNKEYINIYISTLSNKDDIVFNDNYLEAGTIVNYLESDKSYSDKSQYYIENED